MNQNDGHYHNIHHCDEHCHNIHHCDEHYKKKYLDIKQKRIDLRIIFDNKNDTFNLQLGGVIKNSSIKAKFATIKKTLKEKGHSYWFDVKGNILAVGSTQKESKKKLLSKISKNPSHYVNTDVAHVYITTMSENFGENNPQGIIEFDFTIQTIKKIKDNLVPNLRNDRNSLMRFYYRSDTIDQYKRSHAKILAQKLMTDEIFKVNPHKFYHYDDFEEYLD